MKNKSLLLVFFCCTFFIQCNCHKDVDKPEDQLPPATQTGANTLGFLLNGQLWIPKGSNGGAPNVSWYYDPTYGNGDFSVSAYHLNSITDRQYFILGGAVNSTGSYPIYYNSNVGVSFASIIDSCDIFSKDSGTYCLGNLTITRFDTANAIISGTFYFTIYNPSSHCGDTLKITEGRFDLGK